MRKIVLISLFLFFSVGIDAQSLPDTNDSDKESTSYADFSWNEDSINMNSIVSVLSKDTLRQEGQEKTKGLKEDTLLFVGFFVFFIIIIYIKLASPDYLYTQYQYLVNGNFFLTEIDKSKSGYSLNNTLLDILFILVFSIYFFEQLGEKPGYTYSRVLIGLGLFYMAQAIISFIFYYIFFGGENRNVHLLNVLLFNRLLAIVITPVIFISTYLYDPYKQIVANFILILIALIYIYRIIRIFSQLKKLYSYNGLYIFLYLCVFELSLYFVFIKQIGWFI